jgi:urease accessory protein
VTVGENARCEWLPQETILFEGARLSRRLDIALAPGARLLAAEMLVFGRAARGERFRHGSLHDAWRIRRDGRLIWADALNLAEPAAALDRRFVLDGAGAMATLLLAAPDAAEHRAAARDLAACGARHGHCYAAPGSVRASGPSAKALAHMNRAGSFWAILGGRA